MKLSIRKYNDNCASFSRLFDLLRHALKRLGTSDFRDFMKAERQPMESILAQGFSQLAADPVAAPLIPDLRRRGKRMLSEKFPTTPNLRWEEYKGDAHLALNASELILRVSLFEVFMKEIHQAVLVANPKLLARSKPDRPIPLKELFKRGFERFKAKEADRQVREADRLPTKKRAKFYQKSLNLPWGDEAQVQSISDLTELRHRLVHAAPNTLSVLDKDIQRARQVFISTPGSCFQKAASLYPTHFQV